MMSQEAVVEVMERFGMDAVGLISARARSVDFSEGNHQLQLILDGERGIFGYVTLNSAYPDESIEEMRVYLNKRDFLGTVLFPQNGDPVLLADVRDILNAQRRYNKPALIYASDREGVRAAREIAAEFAQMRFLLLNMGGDDWRYAVNAARAHTNMSLELSGTLDADKMGHAASQVSSRKLLFGSGMPYADPSLYLGMLKEANTISALDHRRINYQNALTLFNIEADIE